MAPFRFLAPVFAVALSLSACKGPAIVKSACEADTDCGPGLICDDFNCINGNTKACEVVTDGNPTLQPSPYTVDFGDLDTAESTATIQLHSIGNCTLTVFEATLEGAADGGASDPFSCAFCGGKFPIDIFPNRYTEVQIGFKAKDVGRASDMLDILSDDKQFPTLSVPIHANFLGTPDLHAAPNPVDFGFVAVGRQAMRKVTLSNTGTGIAGVQITAIALSPVDTMDFAMTTTAMPPLTLPPLATDSTALIDIDLEYHPRTNTMTSAELVITTNKGELHVPLTGTSMTPAKAVVAPLTLNLGDVPLGSTNTLPINIQNMGGAPLIVTYTWGGANPSTDFSAIPTVIPPIAPGTFTAIQVAFTATSLTCNVNGCIAKPATGLLVISTNDPEKPSVTIPITANAIPGPGPEVIKLEMTFDNGTDGLFDKDVRNVDMHLEHPFGYVCDKAHPTVMWGNYGNAGWLAFPPKEEPERIILSDALIDATYRVQLTYAEDCKSLPTELLAGLLGISTDLLEDYFAGGLLPGVGGDTVAMLISQICFDHGGTNATVTVYSNGNVIQQKTIGLAHKGDSAYAVDLIRANGTFTAQ